MGTRSVWTFVDPESDESFHVYRHFDGYPSHAAVSIALPVLLETVWQLPRFEADEFAAGWVAANKTEDGNIRLMNNRHSACDVAYGYTVTMRRVNRMHRLWIVAAEVDFWDDKEEEKEIFSGTVWNFCTEHGYRDLHNGGRLSLHDLLLTDPRIAELDAVKEGTSPTDLLHAKLMR